MKKLTILIIIFFFFIPNNVNASNSNISNNDTSDVSTISEEEILKTQQDNLDISSFIEEADKYTKDVYKDIDMGELFSAAITGNIDNETIFRSILNALRRRSARCNICSGQYFSGNSNT